MRYEVSKIEDHVDTRRQLYFSARKIGGVVSGGHLDRTYAENELLRAAVDSGLRLATAERSLRSGLTKGLDTPRHPSKTATRVAADEVEEFIDRYLELVAAHAWKGRGLASSRKLVVGLALQCRRYGKVEINKSYGELAMDVGLSKATIEPAARRVQGEWLAVDRSSPFSRLASTWRLLVPVRNPNTAAVGRSHGPSACSTFAQPEQASTPDPLSDPGHDLWHGRSIAWDVYETLQGPQDWWTVAELVAATGHAPRTVRDQLVWLRDRGVARSAGRLWSVWDPDDVAKRLEPDLIVPARQQRQERLITDRKLHDEWLIERRRLLASREDPV